MRSLLLAGVACEVVEDDLLLRRVQRRQTGLANLLVHLRHLNFTHRRRQRMWIVGLMALAASSRVKLAGVAVLLGQRMLTSGEREENQRPQHEHGSRWS